jgi:Na+/citrate or Na+/malate symporter
MNQELLDLLRDILSQVIAGIPFGTIFSLIIYYALNKIKKKTSEFPEKANEIEVKVKDFSKEVKQGLNDIKQEVTEIVNEKLETKSLLYGVIVGRATILQATQVALATKKTHRGRLYLLRN